MIALNPLRGPNSDLSPKLTPHLTRPYFNKTELSVILLSGENLVIEKELRARGATVSQA